MLARCDCKAVSFLSFFLPHRPRPHQVVSEMLTHRFLRSAAANTFSGCPCVLPMRNLIHAASPCRPTRPTRLGWARSHGRTGATCYLFSFFWLPMTCFHLLTWVYYILLLVIDYFRPFLLFPYPARAGLALRAKRALGKSDRIIQPQRPGFCPVLFF
ncbi:hypothetical protein BJX70DRAFT_272600 [Aspergillus crustosus]